MCVCGRYRLCQKFLISQCLSHKLEVDMKGFSHLAAHSYGLKPIWCECSISAAGIQLNHLLKWSFYFWMVRKYFLSFYRSCLNPALGTWGCVISFLRTLTSFITPWACCGWFDSLIKTGSEHHWKMCLWSSGEFKSDTQSCCLSVIAVSQHKSICFTI